MGKTFSYLCGDHNVGVAPQQQSVTFRPRNPKTMTEEEIKNLQARWECPLDLTTENQTFTLLDNKVVTPKGFVAQD